MPLSPLPHVRGLVLAAGSGSRMGRPKALLRPVGGGPSLVERAVDVLLRGGCDGVTVVLGAAADEVSAALHDSFQESGPVEGVRCPDWAEGMGASLRAGLLALTPRSDVEAVLISLVDLPDVGPDVVHRVGSGGPQVRRPHGGPGPSAALSAALSRAAYRGFPGHPTLIGRDHWAGVIAVARGDRGARDYFETHEPALVECGDLATGRDVDSPDSARRLGLDASG
ncbi:nucleotidyltransferase family protein [Intrasporangium calvum]|uniref:Nucleotidyltransferase family protein n=1 Tax=Intrasporangium calvum TaxID=53358 RepID=A0ABT5GDP0_9MICO|nr:nucleotidyltransferase family protein [Intrasporangium calvum]MDC5696353.1 nucleotidyltransferase family protein [Intrasporangium calvum]